MRFSAVGQPGVTARGRWQLCFPRAALLVRSSSPSTPARCCLAWSGLLQCGPSKCPIEVHRPCCGRFVHARSCGQSCVISPPLLRMRTLLAAQSADVVAHSLLSVSGSTHCTAAHVSGSDDFSPSLSGGGRVITRGGRPAGCSLIDGRWQISWPAPRTPLRIPLQVIHCSPPCNGASNTE